MIELLGSIHCSIGSVASETNDASSCIKQKTALFDIRNAMTRETGKSDVWLGIAHNHIGIALIHKKTSYWQLKVFNQLSILT